MNYRINFRNRVRNYFNWEVPTDVRTRGYLEELPWLRGFVPLRWSLNARSQGLNPFAQQSSVQVKRVDARLLTSPSIWYGNTYLVTVAGDVLVCLKKPLFKKEKNWPTLIEAFDQLSPSKKELVHYAVTVELSASYRRCAHIQVYKFRRNGVGVVPNVQVLMQAEIQRIAEEEQASTRDKQKESQSALEEARKALMSV